MVTWISEQILKIQNSYYREPARPPQTRVSSLPYCPIIGIEANLDFDPTAPNENQFSASFYFSVGTAVHESYQKSALQAAPTELVGNYGCNRVLSTEIVDNVLIERKCARLIKFTTPEDALKEPCPHRYNDSCAPYLNYSELEFSYKGLSGHCDIILRETVKKARKRKNGKTVKAQYSWHIADFKTTGKTLLENPENAIKRGYYPSKKYIEQIETYCVLFEHTHNVEIADYTIAYISRADPVHSAKTPAYYPFSYRWTPARREARQKILKDQLKNHARAVEWLKNPSKENTTEIVDNRPCFNDADYQKKMSFYFFKETCSNLPKCKEGTVKTHVKELAKLWKEKQASPETWTPRIKASQTAPKTLVRLLKTK